VDESARTRRVSSGKLRDAALLAIEGLHALDGKLESVDTLYAAGFRMMGLTHFFDNEVAASAHGVMRTASCARRSARADWRQSPTASSPLVWIRKPSPA
jgi:microsomal dipeptidase-like Zn-dependent dipeptidase